MAGSWTVDGSSAEDLDGCLDIDLESSVLTNAFPVHRLQMAAGACADAPAALLGAGALDVRRIGQRYRRLRDHAARLNFAYESPTFDFECELRYDWHGLLLDYPGIARRVPLA